MQHYCGRFNVDVEVVGMRHLTFLDCMTDPRLLLSTPVTSEPGHRPRRRGTSRCIILQQCQYGLNDHPRERERASSSRPGCRREFGCAHLPDQVKPKRMSAKLSTRSSLTTLPFEDSETSDIPAEHECLRPPSPDERSDNKATVPFRPLEQSAICTEYYEEYDKGAISRSPVLSV